MEHHQKELGKLGNVKQVIQLSLKCDIFFFTRICFIAVLKNNVVLIDGPSSAFWSSKWMKFIGVIDFFAFICISLLYIDYLPKYLSTCPFIVSSSHLLVPSTITKENYSTIDFESQIEEFVTNFNSFLHNVVLIDAPTL